jgi:hypothetical protein
MVGDWSSLKEKFSCASSVPCSHHSWEDFSTTHFHQCLFLGKVDEYNRASKAFQPRMSTIPSEDTNATLHQLHLPPSNLVLHLVFTINLSTFLSWIEFCLPKP